MARKPTGNPNGRPPKEFDKNQFEQLCKMLCTESEICSWFDTTRNTIAEWCKRTYGEGFSAVYKRFAENGKISQRRNLIRMAEKHPGVAIFLAKNNLGMRDEAAIEHKGSGIQIINDIPKTEKKTDAGATD